MYSATIWNEDDVNLDHGIIRYFNTPINALKQIIDYNERVKRIRALHIEKSDKIIFSWIIDEGKSLKDSIKELNLTF